MSFGFGVGDFLAVAKLANDIWQKLHDSIEQFAAIRNEVAGLSSLLDDVSKTVSNQNFAPKQAQGLAASGKACRSVLEDLQKLVDKYGGFTNETRGLTASIRKTTRKFTWDQDDARDLRARITSTTTVLKALSDSVARNQEARRELCQWLSPLDFPAQQREIYSRRQQGAGQWLLESERFKRWLRNDGGVLLCPGDPGAGKTVLASIVIDHLWNNVRKEGIGVAYIYCDYLKYREQTTLHLVGSLLKQLAQQQNPVSESLEGYYNRHRTSNTDPDPKGAFEVLKAECDNWSRIFIIVDALDECSEKDATRQRLVEGLLSLQGSKRINILVTSRPIPSILCDFEVWERLGIRASSADIQDYLLGQMDRFSKRVVVGKDLQAQIISTIVDAADGMFLLAKLTFDSLVGHKNPKVIKATLNKLSGGAGSLDSAYDDAMRRIENQHPDDRDLAKKTLLWILQGKRLLTVAEIQQAVAIELGESDIDPDNMVDCDDIISACTGLVTRARDSDNFEILRLVHYSTQEYLERTKTKYFPNAQQYLASTCLTYLLFDVFSGALCPQADASKNQVWHEAKGFLCFGCKKCWTADQHKSYKNPDESLQIDAHNADICWKYRDEEYSFYAYAAWYWGNHAEHCDDEAVRIMTERFLDDHKRVSGALHFVRDNSYFYRPEGLKLEDSNPGSATQLAAYLGLTKIMFERLENEFEPDVKDWFGATPLFWAAYQGHEDIVKLLMTREDVNPNVRGRYGQTPLMVAVEKQHIAIVQRLLAYEYIEINAKDDWGSSALIYAMRLGQDSMPVSKLLLACDNIDVNLKDKVGQTPLMWAVTCANEGGIRLLLADADIQVNERSSMVQPALQIAAEQGNIEALQLLLAREDLDVNATDDHGESALFAAVRNDSGTPNLDMAELFLARGDVDMNIRDIDGYSPLYYAVHSGQPDVVQLLLTHEDLKISGENGGVGRLVSVAENLLATECEGKRIDAYNAIIILLRSYFQQRSSNTTSANLKQRIPERLAQITDEEEAEEEDDHNNDNYVDAAHGTDNVQVTKEQMLDLAVGESPCFYER